MTTAVPDEPAVPLMDTGPQAVGRPRLRLDWVTKVCLVVLLLMVLACVCAPLYAKWAGTGPTEMHVSDVIEVDGEQVSVVSDLGIPIGPTFERQYLLGADASGRDIAVRLMYGGRNSLLVGGLAMLITILGGTLLGLVAGFGRGVLDAVISRLFEVVWAYPVILLGIALGTTLSLDGLTLGPVTVGSGSMMVPALVIGVVYVPYVGKVIRTQTLSLREREYVDAARVQGWAPARIMLRDVMPNLLPTIVAFVPLILAQAILLESSLSYLGAGVQAPNPSWGTMIGDGVRLLPSALHLTLIPGAMVALTALSINVVGDSVRQLLDPQDALRVRR